MIAGPPGLARTGAAQWWAALNGHRCTLRRWRRRHRRVIVALLLAGSAAGALSALAPADPRREPVVVAAHDLAAGARVGLDELATRAMLPDDIPTGALGAVERAMGQVVAGPVRSGEILTDARLVGPGLLEASPEGTVAVPVRIAEAGLGSVLAAGTRVDIYATSDAGGSLRSARLATAAQVLAADPGLSDSGLVTGGTLLLLAVDDDTAAELATASATARLSVALRADLHDGEPPRR